MSVFANSLLPPDYLSTLLTARTILNLQTKKTPLRSGVPLTATKHRNPTPDCEITANRWWTTSTRNPSRRCPATHVPASDEYENRPDDQRTPTKASLRRRRVKGKPGDDHSPRVASSSSGTSSNLLNDRRTDVSIRMFAPGTT
jgi:hypothetical protein